MRVLHLITDRDRRGAQVHATDLVAGLNELGHVADLVALGTGTDGGLIDVPALAESRRSPTAMRSLRAMARDYDVVVAHGSTTLPVCALALAGATPFVYRQISDPLFWAPTLTRRLRTGVALRRAAAVVALSDDVGATFARHYRLSSDRITTIANAVPAASWPQVSSDERAESRARFGLSPDASVIVFIGALVAEKGCDLAIESTASLAGAHLVIVGDGPERRPLEALAAERCPDRVHFVGATSRPRIALAAGDCVVLPSRGGDSMPATLIEAGLCGLPCVSTPIGAIPEVVRDSVTGRIVPVGDIDALDAAIREVTDPANRSRLADESRRHCAERFTIEAVAPRWVELFAEVIGRADQHS